MSRRGFERLGHGRAAQVERVGERVEVGDGQDVALPRQVVEEDRVGPAAGGDEVEPAAGMERLARIGAGQDVAARAAEDRLLRLARAEAEDDVALAGRRQSPGAPTIRSSKPSPLTSPAPATEKPLSSSASIPSRRKPFDPSSAARSRLAAKPVSVPKTT